MFAISPPACMRFAALVILVWTISAATVFAEERVLVFPEDRSVGGVSESDPPTREDGFLRSAWKLKTIGPARGMVRVPEESFIHLELNSANTNDLSFLRDLVPGKIQSLRVEKISIDRRAMMDIAAQQSLVELVFSNCEFTSDAFTDVSAMPQLLLLSVYRQSTDPERREAEDIALAKWIAGSKRIAYLYCSPTLSTKAFQHLRTHPGIAFAHVRIGDDAEELLSYLREMPNLRGLSVEVVREDETKSLGDLKWPSRIESYSWGRGNIDAHLLRSLSPEGRLRKLRFWIIKLNKDFLAGLRDLKSLEEFNVSPEDEFLARPILDEMPEVLASLPRLKSWPRLRDVDSETWDLICSTERIESLEISGVAEDVTAEDILKLSQLTKLQRLFLERVPVDDAGLERFSTMHDLEYLFLLKTNITGSGFRALGGLKKLHNVDVTFDPTVTPNLREFSRLPALKSLEIWNGMQLQPADLSILYDCRSLRELTFYDMPVDDSTGVWLGQMPNLQRFNLQSRDNESSRMTDRGLRALSLSRSLQMLDVGGFFTPNGAAALARIPSLRWLALYVHDLSEEQQKAFEQKLRTIPTVDVREYLPNLTIGPDGLYRDGNSKLREALDPLEMQPPPRIDAAEKNVFGKGEWKFDDLRGDVVIVYYWSTSNERSVAILQQLRRLDRKYRDVGLRIIGVHAKGADKLPDFLNDHPLSWPTVVDANSAFEMAYNARHYPSVYLIDRRGMLRVAGAHSLGLEDAVQKLLDEPAEGVDGKR